MLVPQWRLFKYTVYTPMKWPHNYIGASGTCQMGNLLRFQIPSLTTWCLYSRGWAGKDLVKTIVCECVRFFVCFPESDFLNWSPSFESCQNKLWFKSLVAQQRGWDGPWLYVLLFTCPLPAVYTTSAWLNITGTCWRCSRHLFQTSSVSNLVHCRAQNGWRKAIWKR